MTCPRRRCSPKRRFFSEEKKELIKGCGPRVKMGPGTTPQGGDGVATLL
jgi:hypothetical protein